MILDMAFSQWFGPDYPPRFTAPQLANAIATRDNTASVSGGREPPETHSCLSCHSWFPPAACLMLAKLHTFSLVGIEAVPVEVEVDVSAGALPKSILVGLPEAAVKESVHRVERALANSGFIRPRDRVVVNLAPAGFHSAS